ncbi:MAG TPA: MerR family transcriptional regulator [Bacteroidota bacterium]|nr:MerR family transcriptional regulator [Bacteroidota bacterium]
MDRTTTKDTPLYPIGTAARMLGVSVHTLRLYERKGLILPHHAPSSQRLYTDRDIERVRCIRRAINMDKISIEGIRRVLSLLPCWMIIGCPKAQRAGCSAYAGESGPCWQSNRKGAHCLGLECRACRVYTEFGECHTIKRKLQELLQPNPSQSGTPA